MAQCQKSADSFLRDAFSPCIGVICTEESNAICLRNHLSFVELLLPFSRLATSGKLYFLPVGIEEFGFVS